MMYRLIFFLTIASVALIYPAGNKLVIASGAPGGTYHQMAESLKEIADIENISTQGSSENINLVTKREADFAFVQLDILIHLYLVNSLVSERVKIVTPVYGEALHIVSKSSTLSVSELSGRRLAPGANGSGTRATAEIILNSAQVTGYTDDRSSLGEALPKLVDNRLDAVFQVSRIPEPSLEKAKGLSLVSIPNDTMALLEGGYLPYQRKIISSKEYSWVEGEVTTIEVPTVMICHNLVKSKTSRQLKADMIFYKTKLARKSNAWNDFAPISQQWIMKKYEKYTFKLP